MSIVYKIDETCFTVVKLKAFINDLPDDMPIVIRRYDDKNGNYDGPTEGIHVGKAIAQVGQGINSSCQAGYTFESEEDYLIFE